MAVLVHLKDLVHLKEVDLVPLAIPVLHLKVEMAEETEVDLVLRKDLAHQQAVQVQVNYTCVF